MQVEASQVSQASKQFLRNQVWDQFKYRHNFLETNIHEDIYNLLEFNETSGIQILGVQSHNFAILSDLKVRMNMSPQRISMTFCCRK